LVWEATPSSQDPLISHLNFLRKTVLAQVKIPNSVDSIKENWLSSEALGLNGRLASEWDRYRRALLGTGINLQNSTDTIVWTGGDSSRILSVKNVYNALISTLDYPTVGGWKLNLWKWNIQLKIKLFIWLAGNQKVLTWDTLQRKGWEGPGIFASFARQN
jgi:hypothetical protein